MEKKEFCAQNGDIVVETSKVSYKDLNNPEEIFLEILSPKLEMKKILYSQLLRRQKFVRTNLGATSIFLPFSPDVYWDVATNGHIIIGFSAKYEFSVYSSDGQPIRRIFYSFKLEKVTEKDKKRFFDLLASNYQKEKKKVPDYIINNLEFPTYKPAYRLMAVDGEGNILVVPYFEMAEKRPPVFDAFTPEGKFINRVEVNSPKFSIVGGKWQAKSVWLGRTDSDGKMGFIKYSLGPKK